MASHTVSLTSWEIVLRIMQSLPSSIRNLTLQCLAPFDDYNEVIPYELDWTPIAAACETFDELESFSIQFGYPNNLKGQDVRCITALRDLHEKGIVTLKPYSSE